MNNFTPAAQNFTISVSWEYEFSASEDYRFFIKIYYSNCFAVNLKIMHMHLALIAYFPQYFLSITFLLIALKTSNITF